MEPMMYAEVRCTTRDILGRMQENVTILLKAPLAMNPPTKTDDLIEWLQDLWISQQLKIYGSGPKGECPHIQIFQILTQKIIQ